MTVVARASKLAILILMASSVAVTVACRGQIMDNMHTRLNVPYVAMSMEQTGLTCTRESALSARKEHPESGIGGLSRSERIRQIWRERGTEWFPPWQSKDENSLLLKRQKRSAEAKRIWP